MNFIILISTVSLTILISAFCSLLEALILSCTDVEIERMKTKTPKRGKTLQKLKDNIDKTTSSILSLNTIANTFGATMSGVLFSKVYGNGVYTTYVFPSFLTISILLFSEILPKNMGLYYRKNLLGAIVFPLWLVNFIMQPISFVCSKIVRLFANNKETNISQNEEILYLAQKSKNEGIISDQGKDLISNALKLETIKIASIMTPRTVVEAIDGNLSISELFENNTNIPFGRLPVYEEEIDNIIGIVRRRDLLQAKANLQNTRKVKDFAREAIFVPEEASASDVLRELIRNMQQIAMIVDEYGSFTGVISMEDILEHLIGKEIFESDDVAIDMRAFAKTKEAKMKKS